MAGDNEFEDGFDDIWVDCEYPVGGARVRTVVNMVGSGSVNTVEARNGT